MPGSPTFAQYHEVRAIALAEMTQIAGALPRRVAEVAFALPASVLARSLVALDGDLAGDSLRLAALTALRRFGVEPVLGVGGAAMRQGPLLVVANHPGLFDALSLFAAIDRDDLATLAARRPLLDALPNLRRRLLAIDPGAAGGLAVRSALRHLRSGGAILHFPAGRIEPDPRVAPRGTPLLRPWEAGLDVLLAAAGRACPGLHVVGALVSGVISPRALAVARVLGRTDGLTDALVPLLQLTFPGFGDAAVRVRFGPVEAVTSPPTHPDPLARLATMGGDPPNPPARPASGDRVSRLRAQIEEMAKAVAHTP